MFFQKSLHDNPFNRPLIHPRHHYSTRALPKAPLSLSRWTVTYGRREASGCSYNTYVAVLRLAHADRTRFDSDVRVLTSSLTISRCANEGKPVNAVFHPAQPWTGDWQVTTRAWIIVFVPLDFSIDGKIYVFLKTWQLASPSFSHLISHATRDFIKPPKKKKKRVESNYLSELVYSILTCPNTLSQKL